MEKKKIKTLFLDIGGVLISNGWDRFSRQDAAEKFDLDPAELSDRHTIFFETYELGKLTLKEYLDNVVFYKPRNFTHNQFAEFILKQSKPVKGSIDYFLSVKKKYKLNVFSLNNEGREIHEYRLRKFGLERLFNGFISSCFVHLRKPDKEIFKLACDISFTDPAYTLFIDDRIVHTEVAKSTGMNTIQFKNLGTTRRSMEDYGFII